MKGSTIDQNISCYHCGEACRDEQIRQDDKTFCCLGCKTVYNVLRNNKLDQYYQIEAQAGTRQKAAQFGKFDYLDDRKVEEELLLFKDDKISSVKFELPQIHCSACIWLLERLYKFHQGVIESKVNFLRREVTILFEHQKISLKELAGLLQSIGYEPNINLSNTTAKKKRKKIDRKIAYQVGLAGFAFGNIMLLSLPEYFGITEGADQNLSRWFNWLNLLLATPVAIYSGQDYFKSAWHSLKQKRLNIDVPIAVGVLVLYLRSTYEIVAQSGSGYFDSLCGLLFFLLLGRLFQQKVYHQLSFERDYQSYFPIAVSRVEEGQRKSVPLKNLKKGDKIFVRNGELIPVDARLIKGNAKIDNSFISGESRLIEKQLGEKIFAGGKQVGGSIYLEVLKPLDQSRLTSLWNRYAGMKKEKYESHFSKRTDKISEWFTPIILLIAIFSAYFHLSSGWSEAIEVVTSVLIVACPCALALAAPFTLGHAIRKAGRKACYFRDSAVMENLASISHIVFDKTGTLTLKESARFQYVGTQLNDYEKTAFGSLLAQSTHPLSKVLSTELVPDKEAEIDHFEEIEGKGILGIIDGKLFQIGSAKWLNTEIENDGSSIVVFAFEKEVIGYFKIKNSFRSHLKEIVDELGHDHELSMISGDRKGGQENIMKIFPAHSQLLFEQSPEEKVLFIENLKNKKHKVAMVGDGLNDSAALQTADVGISIADDVHAFSPASDIILDGKSFGYLPSLMKLAKYSRNIIWISFGISFLYNLIGLSFAVQGLLSPVIAAILMPVSSISVVGFVSLASWLKKLKAVY